MISDVQLLSGFSDPVAAVDLGVASGIGGNSAIVIPDVPLQSGFTTLPSPSTSGVRPASAGMPPSQFPMSSGQRSLKLWLDATPL